ncbi:multiple PDZ domain protein [Clarias gariepinus]|uniref:multiple PDZ domain protein n=1 Tax=Clarias gariepinus TaxID=13013 RepID=UPI00234E2B88|nr:multiple PDZ domain protein [Clarias gariepinus]
MEAICKVRAHQSTGLEKTITVFRGDTSLGMTVSALKDGSGISIRSVLSGRAISKDGKLKVGDVILALNGEPTINLTNAQARAMLRRHSLMGPELSVTYVPAACFDMHHAIQSKQDVKANPAKVLQTEQEPKPDQTTVAQSKQELKMGRATTAQFFRGHKPLDTKWGCIHEQTKIEGKRVTENSCKEGEKEQALNTVWPICGPDAERKGEQEGEARDRVFSLQAKGWRKEETEDKRQRSDQGSWSRPRRVTLIRNNGESFGISVIGGRGMGHRISNGEMRRGIFIKHISEHSPASRDNTLTPGDRILQVGDVDVSDFTHEEAVEAIRQGGDKVELLVQSPQTCEDANNQLLSPSSPFSSIPYKVHPPINLTGNSLSKNSTPHPAPPLSRLPSGPVSLLTDRVTSKKDLERLSGASGSTQHCQKGQMSYWGQMQQKYRSLPGELKLVELDCSNNTSGLGVCVSEIQADGVAAADGRIRVGDELLEINEHVFYGQSEQNAAAVINSVSSKVKIVLIRNKAAPKHSATGSIMEAEDTTNTSPLATNEEHKHDATVTQEEKMRLDKQKPCPYKNPPVSINASSNHEPLHDPTPSFSHITPTSHVPPTSHTTAASHAHIIHHKQSYYSSIINPSASGVQTSSYCSACSVRSDPLTCPIIPGCLNIIDICKGRSGLGLTIVGGCNTLLGVILIHEVNEGGAAHRDGRLMAGDHILEVNGIDLRMASHEEALSVLRLTPQHVRLCVYRHMTTHTFNNQAHTHEDMWELFPVDLQVQPGQDLGLSIVGKRNDTGIFVSEIKQGGVAESDARLSLGDQILSVNGEDIRAVTQDYARTLLQNCSGSVLLEIARFRATPHYPYECQNNLPGW